MSGGDDHPDLELLDRLGGDVRAVQAFEEEEGGEEEPSEDAKTEEGFEAARELGLPEFRGNFRITGS